MKICYLAEAQVIHTEKWAQYFASQGHEVHVISLGEKTIENVHVHPLKKIPFLGKLNYIVNIPLVRKTINSISPDLIHVHHASSYGLLGWLSCPKIPFFITCHGSDILVFPKNWITKKIINAILHRADLITSVANHLTEKIVQLGIPPQKVKTFQYGLELDLINEAAPKKIHDGITIISTRQLKKIYNYELLFSAIPLIKKSLKGFKVLIVGDGPEEERLKAIVNDMGLQNDIIFYGAAPHSEVISLLKGADIFVSTSLSDGTSMCLLEAFACKVLPVVTDIPANRELIDHQKNGLLVPTDSPDELATAIVKALNIPDKKDIVNHNFQYICAEQDSKKNFAFMENIYQRMLNNFNTTKQI